jgi:hypothetical protein
MQIKKTPTMAKYWKAPLSVPKSESTKEIWVWSFRFCSLALLKEGNVLSVLYSLDVVDVLKILSLKVENESVVFF